MEFVKNKYYGRIKSRKLKESQKLLIKNKLPLLEPTLDILNSQKEKVLEIGFGMGNFIINKAKEYPNKIFIGVDPYINGLLSVLKQIEHIKNIYIYKGLVEDFFENIPNFIFDEVYILHPDPWPKKRHHKRRLIQKKFLDQLSMKIKEKGNLYISCDDIDYQEWIFKELSRHISFKIISKENSRFITKYYKQAKTKTICFKVGTRGRT